MEKPESKKKNTRVKKVTKTTVTTTEVKVKAERKPRQKKAETKVETPVVTPEREHIDGNGIKLTLTILLIMLVVLVVFSISKKETPKAQVEPQSNVIMQDTTAKDTVVTVLDTGKVDTIVTAGK